MPATLGELARRFGGQARGADDRLIRAVASLERAEADQIAYLADKKYRSLLGQTRAGAVVLSPRDAEGYAGNALIVENPSLCFARITAWLHPPHPFAPGRHPSAQVEAGAVIAVSAWIGPHAVVEAGAVVGDDVYLGPGCYVGRGARIGARTRMVARATLMHDCEVGADCVIQPGAVIGAEGFGFAKDGDRWIKVPQLGRVVVGNDVEIGANTTIDRGTLDDTVVADGVKLDNLIHIAHNVRVGEHTIMAACVGIAGSTTIGKRCAFGGQVGVAGHLEIGDDVQVLGKSLVSGPIAKPGIYSSAMKVEVAEQWRRIAARIRQLDDMARRLRELEQQVRQLKEETSS